MNTLIKGLIQCYGRPTSMCFDKAAGSPKNTQKSVLHKILRKNGQSVFGKAHGFSSIRSETEFRKQIPVRDFEAFRPYINQIISGKKSVLTVSEPIMFNLTSGTTGESKYIPVTRETQAAEINLIGQWYYWALRDHPEFLDYFRLAMVSSVIEGRTASGIPFGSASGMIFNQIPEFIRRLYVIPDWVSQIKNYEKRYFLTVRLAAEKRISFIMTPNPSTLIRLAEVMNKSQEEIIRAIHDGVAGIDLSEQPEINQKVAHFFKPNKERAKFLAGILQRTGSIHADEIWPELKLLACWLGGSVGIQARRLSSFYGEKPIRDIGYMASEAHITIPHRDNTSSGILAIQTNYYEFIPEESYGIENPSVLLSHELEQGKRYAILITTRSGLYRYDINDIVEVTGFYQNTPLLAFVRKGRDMTSITGEKMHANHFLSALEEVRRKFNLPVDHFRAAPDFTTSRYAIYMELNSAITDEFLRNQVIPFLDQALGKLNIEYAQKRQSKRIKSPYLCLMRQGWADEVRRKFIQSGKRDVQYKWRVLCSEPDAQDADFILKTIESVND